MQKKLLAIDGNNIINRAFYGMPLLTGPDGEYINAVYGFLNIFFKLYDEEKPDYIAVAFDVREKTFRHDLFAEYKGTRKPSPPELHPQIVLLKNCLLKMGVCCIEAPGFEADDILGTLAARAYDADIACVIVSGDKDMLQLAGETTLVRIPKTKGGKTVTENYRAEDIQQQMGITPRQYIDVKALMGDSSDNIPGVTGIGEKTALRIIKEYGSLENAIQNAEHLKPKKAAENLINEAETARLSLILAQIRLDAPIEFIPEKMTARDMYNNEAKSEIIRLGLKRIAARFTAQRSRAGEYRGYKNRR